MTLPNLPLVHNDDSYLIHLEDDGRDILLLYILRFANNATGEPDNIPFFHLDERTRHAVLQQIRRRYASRNIRVA